MNLVKVLAGLAVVLSANVSANLIVNGSFEDNSVASGSWAKYKASDVNGWDGQNFEIWDTFGGTTAYEGDQLLELNAWGARNGDNNSYVVSQSFSTDINELYAVEFAYKARTNNDESFLFEINDELGNTLYSEVLDDHTKSDWLVFDTTFLASSALASINFTSINSGTVGNLIDAINVTRVPEPATFAPFAAALLLVGARRMKKAR
ncbi:DUF642 domain-containing protein [Alteromonas sp. C1M14]|uniref:DUF642 domain-containing protein n=1 Tax=Alteromonas sp. C1M14 TaxID=2841567 RepID=UPI001C08D49D|nr:DUF642 domain-containing protein [Alteromonas sp. C1M14]MBU2978188.1 DUF642 domain-containing protein [Alteromonas sp. C1M14]